MYRSKTTLGLLLFTAAISLLTVFNFTQFLVVSNIFEAKHRHQTDEEIYDVRNDRETRSIYDKNNGNENDDGRDMQRRLNDEITYEEVKREEQFSHENTVNNHGKLLSQQRVDELISNPSGIKNDIESLKNEMPIWQRFFPERKEAVSEIKGHDDFQKFHPLINLNKKRPHAKQKIQTAITTTTLTSATTSTKTSSITPTTTQSTTPETSSTTTTLTTTKLTTRETTPTTKALSTTSTKPTTTTTQSTTTTPTTTKLTTPSAKPTTTTQSTTTTKPTTTTTLSTTSTKPTKTTSTTTLTTPKTKTTTTSTTAALKSSNQSKKKNTETPSSQIEVEKYTRTKIGENQNCVIPDLDPFHPNVRPYISYRWRQRCGIKQNGKVEDGKLILKLKHVERAGFYYIRRDGDFGIQYSEWIPLMNDANTTLKHGNNGCLRLSDSNFILSVIGNNGHQLNDFNNIFDNTTLKISATTKEDNKCDDNKKFLFRADNKFVHIASGWCLALEDGITFLSKQHCNEKEKSTFEVQEGSIIRHLATNKCLRHKDRLFRLENCNFESAKFYFEDKGENRFKDIQIAYLLKEDFVRLEIIIQHNQPIIEYHMYPIKTSAEIKEPINSRPERQNQPIKSDKLSIVMIMVDSLSRASAERYMNRTYKFLENDPDTVILKGHTIVGDGTTPQLCAMLVGKQEHELPESRRGFKGAAPVDRWNFIFKDYKGAGYTTLYSEDEPAYNTFHYRLHGFEQPPTTKYLRPWWMAADLMLSNANAHSRACSHQFSYPYLKEFLKVYEDDPTFTLLISSALTHAESTRSTLIDEDVMDFFTFLDNKNYRNNTIVIFFGDHGNRASEFRSSIQGKLEERLPMMSFSLPPWFRKTYPDYFRNIQRNSRVMTSHYDIHVTLKHFLDFPSKSSFEHPYGRSLFSNIVKLNRTCESAGVDQHWCPCLTYTDVKVSETLVKQVTDEMIKAINEKISKYQDAKSQCSNLSLDRIIRASQTVPNTHVQQYEGTYRNEVCDACGVSLNKNAKSNLIGYEVVFSVLPSHGQFEATADFDVNTKQIIVNEHISRINLYGNQPRCIADRYPYLRSFCFCKVNSVPLRNGNPSGEYLKNVTFYRKIR